MDCGQCFPPCVMQWDHRDPATKAFPVSKMSNRSVPVILAEIAKCDLVCANCHLIRTWITRPLPMHVRRPPVADVADY